MAYKYNIKQNAGDAHVSTPYWLGVIVRFAVRDSFNRNFDAPGSKPAVVANPVAEDEPLFIESDCISWSTSSSKSSHVSNLQLQLIHSDTDYVASVSPDDWVMFWAFDNYEAFADVRQRLKSKSPCNKFDDGLKFVGRVDSIRKQKVRDPNSGRLSAYYSLTGIGFSEFDSVIYYNEAVTKNYANVLQFMPDFGLSINKFILSGRTNPQTAIPELLGICLGLGPGEKSKGFSAAATSGTFISEDFKKAAKAQSLQASPNSSYRVPQTIAYLLGRTTPLRSVGFTYVDLLNQYIGIQRYDGQGFVPVIKDKEGQTFFTPDPLDGEALPYPLNFNKTTVWSILGTFLNAPINEMYTCLRHGPDGIMPTFVCRQLPLSSREFLDAGGLGTAFVDLPRWDIADEMIRSIDVGRSNAARFNYVYLTGQANLGGGEPVNKSQGHSRNPPIIDDGDILRAGLRMYDTAVSGTIIETTFTNKNSPGRRWSKMMADILFGGHLKYTGTISCNGIQQPICEGDNVTVDGIIYHIERIQHQGSVNENGQRSFMTTLYVTNGISVDSERLNRQVYPDMRATYKDPLGLGGSRERRQKVAEDKHIRASVEEED